MSPPDSNAHHSFAVPVELAGSRLDLCLTSLRPEWSRSRVQRLIQGGHVQHNQGPAKAATPVRAGDLLTVHEPPPEPSALAAEEIPLEILFEDDELLVINKPSGLVIHPAAGNRTGTLVQALLHHCQGLSVLGGVERPGIVHRLDKDTSGCMVVAKSDRAHQGLSLAFRWRRVSKVYLAVCYGVPRAAEGVIDAPIGRHRSERKQMAVVRDGRPARTRYRVAEALAGVALVRCRLETGRTHQIRVHMAHIGHALVGDPLYAGRQWRNIDDPDMARACRSFPRQALHASKLGFVHPATGAEMVFEAPLPDDMRDLLETLRGRASDPAGS